MIFSGRGGHGGGGYRGRSFGRGGGGYGGGGKNYKCFWIFATTKNNYIFLLQVVMVAETDTEVVVEAMAEAEEVSNNNLRIKLVKAQD